MSDLTIEQALMTLTKTEALILYWKCKGLPRKFIARQKVPVGVDMVQIHMSNVYAKLGFDLTLHHSARKEILQNEFCPVLFKLCNDNPENIKRRWPPDLPNPQPNTKALVVVIEDEIRDEDVTEENTDDEVYEGKPHQALERRPPHVIRVGRPSPVRRAVTITAGIAIVSVLCAAALLALIAGYFYFSRNTSPTTITYVTVVAPTQANVQDTIPVPTAQGSNPTPINTPKSPPTSPPEYYTEGQLAVIEQGVYLQLWDRFISSSYSLCEVYPGPGYNIGIEVINEEKEEFLIRFNWQDFEVTDNTGKQYSIVNSGVDECVSPPGMRSYSLRQGRQISIIIQISGEFPLDTQYLIIKVFNISGSGPFTFHKDI